MKTLTRSTTQIAVEGTLSTYAFEMMISKMYEKEIDGDLRALADAYGIDIDELEIEFRHWRVLYQDNLSGLEWMR